MGRTNFLGEFEELILTMVLILDDNAYGNTVVKAIKEHQNREVNLSSVHITLYRLEEKGFLKSYMAGATQKEVVAKNVISKQQIQGWHCFGK